MYSLDKFITFFDDTGNYESRAGIAMAYLLVKAKSGCLNSCMLHRSVASVQVQYHTSLANLSYSVMAEGTFHQGRHAVYTASSDETGQISAQEGDCLTLTVGVWSVNKRRDSIEAAPSKTFLDTASTLHPAISSAKSSFRGIWKHVSLVMK